MIVQKYERGVSILKKILQEHSGYIKVWRKRKATLAFIVLTFAYLNVVKDHSYSNKLIEYGALEKILPGLKIIGNANNYSDLNDQNPPSLSRVRRDNENLIESERAAACTVDKRKIFNIGLPRTGTMSFTNVLKQYGFRSCHPFAEKTWTMKEVRSFIENPHSKSARRIKRQFSLCDAFSDTPIFGMMEQLLTYFPDARFIVTTREIDTWADSCKRLMSYNCRRASKNYIDYRMHYYGTKCWDETKWRNAYHSHHARISELFPNRILYIPIEMPNQEKLSFLLRYLGCPLINGTSYIHKQHAPGAQTMPGGKSIEKLHS